MGHISLSNTKMRWNILIFCLSFQKFLHIFLAFNFFIATSRCLPEDGTVELLLASNWSLLILHWIVVNVFKLDYYFLYVSSKI